MREWEEDKPATPRINVSEYYWPQISFVDARSTALCVLLFSHAFYHLGLGTLSQDFPHASQHCMICLIFATRLTSFCFFILICISENCFVFMEIHKLMWDLIFRNCSLDPVPLEWKKKKKKRDANVEQQKEECGNWSRSKTGWWWGWTGRDKKKQMMIICESTS